ncbi:hypothetical protein V5O48_004390 [Marasmius crinis-equi]|uniref:Metallo-beta-lactamase domain-containing protein n=1 Tax=Marasmius crinis-equi TaxID=585013 RepID=A0ABR3FR49_9AGAR
MSNDPVELIFLGTGTSSSLPSIGCLTLPRDGSDEQGCRACLSTLKPEGKKNIRRNTSAAVRMKDKKGQPITIVIDAGKTFQAAALEWFPTHGLRRIDALLLTHAHADAMNGLDDLRGTDAPSKGGRRLTNASDPGWTLGSTIQDHVDVYLSQATFQEVKRSFPYLVSKEYASGGGDVPDFIWHIIDDGVPFEINDTGIFVTPFAVHHGRIFSTLPCPAYAPTPTNDVGHESSAPVDMMRRMNINGNSSPQFLEPNPQKAIQPYYCFGYKIEDHLVYISDVSYIPESAWSVIRGTKDDSKRLPVCVLDCLGPKRHASHFGLDQSVATAREIGALRSYFVGFSHRVSHEEYVTITEVLGGKTHAEEGLSEKEREGISMLGDGENIWARPAHDGLRVLIDGEDGVRDETYDPAPV